MANRYTPSNYFFIYKLNGHYKKSGSRREREDWKLKDGLVEERLG